MKQVVTGKCVVWVTLTDHDFVHHIRCSAATAVSTVANYTAKGMKFESMAHAPNCHCAAKCAACAAPIEHCEGHSADAELTDILAAHDDGKHDRCHIESYCKKADCNE